MKLADLLELNTQPSEEVKMKNYLKRASRDQADIFTTDHPENTNSSQRYNNGYPWSFDDPSGIFEDEITELRQGLLNYLIQQLPNTPEYVIKDMIYRSIKTAHNAGDIDQEYIDQFKDIKWEKKTNFPVTMDIFTDETKKELESRIGGYVKKDIPNDEERLQLQRDKLKSQGISKEPIILFKTKDGKYDLAEGKHRTIEAFKIYPEGFIQPNVYIGLNAKWLNEAKRLQEIAGVSGDSKELNRMHQSLIGREFQTLEDLAKMASRMRQRGFAQSEIEEFVLGYII
jgi:hypothetical protein